MITAMTRPISICTFFVICGVAQAGCNVIKSKDFAILVLKIILLHFQSILHIYEDRFAFSSYGQRRQEKQVKKQ